MSPLVFNLRAKRHSVLRLIDPDNVPTKGFSADDQKQAAGANLRRAHGLDVARRL